jgi:glycine oxidase
MIFNQQRILIVGQGLAGTVLAATLEQHGAAVFILDRGRSEAASSVAAGIINPITGKRYVKTWLLDAMLPVARDFYQKMEAEAGLKFWNNRRIIKILSSIREANDWSARMALPDYVDFLGEIKSDFGWKSRTPPPFLFGEIRGAAQVDLSAFLTYFKEKMVEKGRFWEEKFDFEALSFNFGKSFYRKENFGKVIFCDGWHGQNNPFFQDLNAWRPAKGEALLVKIPNFKTDDLLKKQTMIAPWKNDLFWVGATNSWDFSDTKPTPEMRESLENDLRGLINCPFEIVEHLAAVRPTIMDQRPVIGLLDKNPSVGIFNGMGTKGTLLAPFWAEKFAKHLISGEKLPEIVDFRRFL